jgi:hypothetical protein
MKIGYFIRNYVLDDGYGKPLMAGGVKVVSQHVKLLNEIKEYFSKLWEKYLPYYKRILFDSDGAGTGSPPP